MSTLVKSNAKTPKPLKVIGRSAYAAMAAVEGLRLSKTSEIRLSSLREKKLSPEERRAEVVRAYAGSALRK